MGQNDGSACDVLDILQLVNCCNQAARVVVHRADNFGNGHGALGDKLADPHHRCRCLVGQIIIKRECTA